MTSWMKERDRLVEQTMAFVQGVAAQRPIKLDSADVNPPELAPSAVVATPVEIPVEIPVETPVAAKPARTSVTDASLVEAEALMSLIAMSLPSLRTQPVTGSEPTASVSEPIELSAPAQARLGASPAVYVPAPKRPNQFAIPEREMIARRVDNFRAAQLRLIREREDNYAAVQAKIRATLGNDPQPR
ncbi:MAG: hypothetical protein JWQ51_2352 [Tardiphaga sp.]|nr:hypothetical protein [Tardiphaga sp.]